MVVHPNRHPRAEEVLVPSNPEIAKKFGEIRVEDWDDRVAGATWRERHSHGGFPEVLRFLGTTNEGDLGHTPADADVVRCHSTTTGDLVLLHNDWL